MVVLLMLCASKAHAGAEDSLLLALQQQQGAGDVQRMALTALELGNHYYYAYEDSLCEVYLKHSIDWAAQSNDVRTQAKATNMLGNLVSVLGDHEQAIALYQQAIELAANNDTLRASFMNNKGLELKAIGKYKEAIELLYEALTLKEKINASDRSLSSTLLNLGLIWDLLEDSEKALDYYERSLVLKRKLQDSLGISRLLSNISVVVKNQGDLDRTIALIEESIRYNRTTNNLEQHYINHVNLGNVYKRKEEFDGFKTHMDSAYYYASSINNPDYLSDVHQNLGTHYFEQHNYPQAINHLQEALQIPGENITGVLLFENHKRLAEAYAAIGNPQQAYLHLEQSNAYRDSIYAIEHQQAIQEAREKYETERKEKELALKDLELAQSNLAARRKTTIILFLVGGIVIASLLAFIVFRHYRERQRKKLIMSEQRLQKYREELEVLRLGIQSHLNKAPAKIDVNITQADINQYLVDPLTEREVEILTEIASGKTNKAVAEAVFVSENTVKYHLKNIYLKLDVKNRTEAITKADALNIWNRL